MQRTLKSHSARVNVLLGVTDHESVAGALLPIIQALETLGSIRTVLTKSGQQFITEEIPGVLVDDNEWHQWKKNLETQKEGLSQKVSRSVRQEHCLCAQQHANTDSMQVGDDIQHIELTRWADCLLVAPCSAHFLAKLAHGLCDDLLSCVARAWPQEQPILLVPVMHHHMWQHKATSKHLELLNQQQNLSFLLDCGMPVGAVGAEQACCSALPSPERLTAAVNQLQLTHSETACVPESM